MNHLNTRLQFYLHVAEQNSQILENQSNTINSMSTQLFSLNEQVQHNILHLEHGFERLRKSMHLTELSILSWSLGDTKIWIIAGLGGFLLGTFAGLLRWIIVLITIGINTGTGFLILGIFVLFMTSQKMQLPEVNGYTTVVALCCLGICLGPILYFFYSRAEKWRKSVEKERSLMIPDGWPRTQNKSYYMEG